MELWIRSQDRHNLLKIDRLDVDDCTIQANFKAYNDGCDYIIIGRYQTNKRALEVLDEIHKILKPKGIIRYDGFIKQEDIKEMQAKMNNEYLIFNKNIELLQQTNTYVYEMPKE